MTGLMSLPRIITPGATYLITRRTLRRYHLLAPDPAMTNLFLYLLGVYAAKFGILVHEATLMATHEHIVLTDPFGLLPDFLREFHRVVALGVKSLRKWEGAVWDDAQTSVVRLETEEAIFEKIAYSMANPVAATLVEHACEWPGLTCAPSDLGIKVFAACRPAVFVDPKNPMWPERVTVALTLPPSLAALPAAEFRRRVADELALREAQALADARVNGRTFLGPEGCRRSSPYRRSRSFEPLRARNPTFAVGRGNREALIAAATHRATFRRSYAMAREQWRRGIRDAVFPQGTWWMKRHHGAQVEAVAEVSQRKEREFAWHPLA